MTKGLYETIPPLKPEEESKIQGRDMRFSDELILGRVNENPEAKMVMDQVQKKVDGLRQEIRGIDQLMNANFAEDVLMKSRFDQLRLGMDEIERDLTELGISPTAEKIKNITKMLDSMQKSADDLMNTRFAVEDEIKKFETLN